AEKEILHLARQVLAGPLVGQIETILVDQHGLVLHPGRPRLLADRGVDPLAELARIRREIEPLGLALQIYALHRSCHRSLRRGRAAGFGRYCAQPSFFTNTCERRSQLYLRLRASGSQSGSTWTKPRFKNQCMVRVVSTKILSRPSARARCS